MIPAKDKSRILGHQSSVLARQAAGIVATVRSLSDTLHQHKRQYLDTNIGGGASSMTEPERNQVIQHSTRSLLPILCFACSKNMYTEAEKYFKGLLIFTLVRNTGNLVIHVKFVINRFSGRI